MKLTFTDDSDLILELAEKVARKYARLYGAMNYDDSFQAACLYIPSIEFDSTFTQEEQRAYIKKTVYYKLCSERRKESRRRELLRNKAHIPKRQTSFSIDDLEIVNFVLERTYRRERDIIVDFVFNNLRNKELALKYGITKGRVSQIVHKFKRRLAYIAEFGARVTIVDANEERVDEQTKQATPLFYWSEKK